MDVNWKMPPKAIHPFFKSTRTPPVPSSPSSNTKTEPSHQKKPKPSTKTQAQTQWQNVLSQYLTSPESFTSAVVVKATEKVVVINDAFPKAKLHFLLLPRMKDLEMLEMLKRTVEELRNNHPDATLRAGFHAIPSMAHLHLHLISDDFISPALKNKKHWNSFTTPFFVPLDKVIDEVTRNGCIKVDKEANEWLLKGPLVCHKCQQTLKNIPDLKRHLEIHVESVKNG
ncbi:HIT-like protein [Rhizoclosmatium globosum]|uniref:HIT-like protein n=1 Tax=Rhizoclosmatium globosum TaxID=329046 RepID=A0A1Y2BPN8_9FUNG|nr:HIT-like protein [Rhizoclosmatium globosum]|eukprot:ORY36711.1 HIT-like protein [Rhizoclosmatium globosum]